MITGLGVSERRVCAVLDVPRSRLQPGTRTNGEAKRSILDPELVAKVKSVITEFPTYGYRRIRAILRRRDQTPVSRRSLCRVLKHHSWFVHQRNLSPRPRVQSRTSKAARSDLRWAIDVTHIHCGNDGWGHLTAVIDCHDREIVGFELALRGRAKEAERAPEAACINRFGTLRMAGTGPVLRSDNGLIFNAQRFRAACKEYRLKQEFITPYCPQQNGMIERFFRSLKEECVWLQRFATFTQARRVITKWIDWYNTGRPHQSLDYRSPLEYRQQLQLVA